MPGLMKEAKKKKQEISVSEENGSKMDLTENGDLVDEHVILENGIENDENNLNKKSEMREENEVNLFALKLGNFINKIGQFFLLNFMI
jgi:hypothetical protein